MVGFENREIFLTEMTVLVFATVQGEQKRIIRIIRVEEKHITEVEDVIAGNSSEERIQKVVFLFVQLRVVNAEHLVELSACPFHFRQVEVVYNDGQREIAEVIAFKFDLLDAVPELSYLRFLRVVQIGRA